MHYNIISIIKLKRHKLYCMNVQLIWNWCNSGTWTLNFKMGGLGSPNIMPLHRHIITSAFRHN